MGKKGKKSKAELEAERIEEERLAEEQRIAEEKAEAERIERERIAAEKLKAEVKPRSKLSQLLPSASALGAACSARLLSRIKKVERSGIIS